MYISRDGSRKSPARCHANVLRQIRPLPPQRLAPFEGFILAQNNFREWFSAWKMLLVEENPNNRDLLVFKEQNEKKVQNLIENEIERLGSVKVSFGLEVEFSRVISGET